MRKCRFLAVVLVLGLSGLSGSSFAQSAAIVAQLNLANQTRPLRQTVFMPTYTGIYRISVFMEITTSSAVNSFWSVDHWWTDETGPERGLTGGGLHANAVHPDASTSYVSTFRAFANHPIQIEVVNPGPGGGSAYQLHVTLEQLELEIPLRAPSSGN